MSNKNPDPPGKPTNKRQQPEQNEDRYPQGCPIDGHQGYGCTCNQMRVKRQRPEEATQQPRP